MVLPAEEITSLLKAARQGDGDSADRLMIVVYDGLRKVARRYMASERPNHTLQPTVLVNDVLLRLLPHSGAEVSQDSQSAGIDWQSRAHFLGVAARQMRLILIDHARVKGASKRNFGLRICVEDMRVLRAPQQPEFEFETLNRLLEALETKDPDAARVIELKFFGGLTDAETAEVMNTNQGKVRRDWEFGRSWLRRRLLV
jgi:RNA polymerase sigma-70 factor (ECF subfamily)